MPTQVPRLHLLREHVDIAEQHHDEHGMNPARDQQRAILGRREISKITYKG